MTKFITLCCLFLLLCIPSSVFATNFEPFPGNWIKVARFEGSGSIQTRPFTCEHPEWRIRYLSQGMTIYATPVDTIITEIHLTEYIVQPGRKKIAVPDSLTSPASKSYRLYK